MTRQKRKRGQLSARVGPTLLREVAETRAADLHTFASSKEALLESVGDLLPDAIVFDPSVSPTAEAAIEELRDLRQQFPFTPLVVYSHLTRELAKVVLAVSTGKNPPVVLLADSDGPTRLERTLERLAHMRATDRVLVALRDTLRQLPPLVQVRLQDLFRRPNDYTTIEQLVEGSGVSRRHFYRQLEAAGFHAGKDIMIAARMVYAFEDLKNPKLSLREVAKRAGYEDPSMFARHMRRVVGVLPRAVRTSMHVEEFVRRATEAALGRRDGSPRRLLP